MQLQEIKEIIASQREEIEERFEKTKIIEREVDRERLKGFLKSPNVLAILGQISDIKNLKVLLKL